jgi:hypothetical protein
MRVWFFWLGPDRAERLDFRPNLMIAGCRASQARAFSSEVGTGSREENA